MSFRTILVVVLLMLNLTSTTQADFTSDADFTTDMVAWYTFNPNEELIDRTAPILGDINASDLTNNTGLLIEDGLAVFTGNDYLTAIEAGGELNPTANGWTLWARISQPGNLAAKRSIIDRVEGPAGYQLRLDDDGDNMLRGAVILNGGFQKALSNPDEVPVDQFVEVAFVWNGTSNIVELFVDGEKVSDQVIPLGASYTTPSTPLTIGRRADIFADYFIGSIDEIRIYNRALTTTNINQIEPVDPSDVVPDSSRGGPRFIGSLAGMIESDNALELSGIAASRTNENVLWYHNDSGDTPRVMAMNTQGEDIGVFNLIGATLEDWEDMAVGPGPIQDQEYLYLGDIGGNADANIRVTRPEIIVFRVAAPVVTSDQAPVNINLEDVQALNFLYPGGQAFDAETLMVDPINGDIYVVTKDRSGAGISLVFRAAAPHTPGITVTMEEVATIDFGSLDPAANNNQAVGGDISPNGDEIIIKTTTDAYLWKRPAGEPLAEAFSTTGFNIPLFVEPQGESIGFDASGDGYFTATEKRVQPLYYFTRATPGDINLDGIVDHADMAIFLQNYGMSANAVWENGDFDFDGAVTLRDLLLIKTNFSQTSFSPSPITVVPEPPSLLLFLFAIIGLLVLIRLTTRMRRFY